MSHLGGNLENTFVLQLRKLSPSIPGALETEHSCISWRAVVACCYRLHQGGCLLLNVGIQDLFWFAFIDKFYMPLATPFSKHVLSTCYLLGTAH